MSKRRVLISAQMLLAAAALVVPGVVSAGWFDPDTRELVASAKPLESDKDADVVVLAEEADATFTADGRQTFEYRLAYRIVTAKAVDDWSTIQGSWSPWYEEKPEIRARVIDPEGTAHELDPATLVERAARDVNDAVFDDRRYVGAPLPSVAPGAIVETMVTVRETRPLFERGVAGRFGVGRAVPVRRCRFRATAPSSLPLRVELVGLPGLEAKRREVEGGVEITVDAASLPARALSEASSPPDATAVPYVGYSTGASWKDVALGYSTIVQGKLQGTHLEAAAKPVLRGRTTREAKIEALTGWLHEKIRYTGVEFGAGSIVPASPGETLARGFGDCKDKSLLLVGLLREAGIEADLALLLTGPDPEVDPRLPGLGVFDHAIVRVAGTPPVWIDATDDGARPGVLPPEVEGRLALLVNPATEALAPIPESTSSDNREELTREIFVPERGRARVIETSVKWGRSDRESRHAYLTADADEVRESFEKAAKEVYTATSVDRFDMTKLRDLSTPFTISFEVSGSKTGAGFVDGTIIHVELARMWDDLESQLPGDAETKRVSPIWISKPISVAWQFLIHLPPGMAVGSLPENGSRSLGAARLTTRSSPEPDGTVRVRFEADSGPRQWTEEDLKGFREAVKNLENAKLSFEQTGYTYRKAGRFKEALVEYRRLSALHPKEALHLTETAEVLLAAGLGVAAREEARRAVALDPHSADAYKELGWVYMHDEAGRQFRTGCDLGEAERALRAMMAIDSSDPQARANLGLLLERNSRLVFRGPGARLADAVEVWKGLRDELKDTSHDANLLYDLAVLGRYDEMLELLPSMGATTERSAMELVAVCGKEGIASALARAQRMSLTDASRRDALMSFARFELGQRRYPDAAKAFAAAATGSPNAVGIRAAADWMSTITPASPQPAEPTDPKSTVLALVESLWRDMPADSFSELFYERSNGSPSEARFESTVAALRRATTAVGLTPEVMIDVFHTAARWTVEGDAAIGWRVGMTIQVPGQAKSLNTYLIDRNGKPRLLASGVPFSAAGHILDLVDRGELAGAKTWLDWAASEFGSTRDSDPLAAPGFLSLWHKGDPADADRMRGAAAALGVGTDSVERCLAVLEPLKTTIDDRGRGALYGLLLDGYEHAKRWDAMAVTAREATKAWPESQVAFEGLTDALIKLRRLDELDAAATDRLSRLPDDLVALRAASRAGVQRGPRDGWDAAYRRLIESKKAWLGDYNNYAWAALAFGRVSDEDLEHAKHGASGKEPDTYALNTLASVYAEIGKCGEAREALLAGMEADDADRLAGADWYVLGRIAESLGEMDEARRDYSRAIALEESVDTDLTSLNTLAQRRLSGLPTPSRPASSKRRAG